VLALPALVTLGVPVLLDVPGIGEVSVPEETYTSLINVFVGHEADESELIAKLQEQVEHQPESLIHAANEIPAG